MQALQVSFHFLSDLVLVDGNWLAQGDEVGKIPMAQVQVHCRMKSLPLKSTPKQRRIGGNLIPIEARYIAEQKWDCNSRLTGLLPPDRIGPIMR